MTIKVSDNQYGRPHPSDSWASCYTYALVAFVATQPRTSKHKKTTDCDKILNTVQQDDSYCCYLLFINYFGNRLTGPLIKTGRYNG